MNKCNFLNISGSSGLYCNTNLGPIAGHLKVVFPNNIFKISKKSDN